MDPRILDSQKQRDVLPAFWPRKISPYITAVLVRTPITAHQTTVLWGIISAANSYVVSRVLIGDYLLLPIIPLVYILTYVLDCVDGEVARVRQIADPVGGKLLDGICHRTTEYSLLAAYALAAYHLTASPWVLPVALLLFSGEAMGGYAYERRLMAIRVHMGFSGAMASEDKMYPRGAKWADLSRAQKIVTIKGQLHYKSIYAIIAAAYVSGSVLLAGLALFAAYKHVSWIRLIAQTLDATRNARNADAQASPAAMAPVVQRTGSAH
jgi:phosphatidylglycerophosphate synthase